MTFGPRGSRLPRRTAAAIAIGLAAGFAMPQLAQAADQALIDAAKKEGAVVWYTTLIVDQAARPLEQAFEAKYPGIDVQFARAGSSETALKIMNEARAGATQADVFDGASTYRPLIPAGLVEPYVPDSAAELLPQHRGPEGLWHAVNLTFMTVAINTDLVPPEEAPKTWEDLLDPKWKGKMVWSVEPESDAAPGFVGNILLTMGEEKGREYIEKLAAQEITNMSAAPRAVLDRVILGDFPIALTSFNHHAVISKKEGAPIQWLTLEPVVNNASLTGLVKDAPHPNAGKLFIDFMLSEEGQTVLREANYIPVHPNVQPLDPSLRPAAENGFKVTVMSPEVIQNGITQWVEIVDQNFR